MSGNKSNKPGKGTMEALSKENPGTVDNKETLKAIKAKIDCTNDVINKQAILLGEKDKEIEKIKAQCEEARSIADKGQRTIQFLMGKIGTMTSVAEMTQNEMNNAFKQ